MNHLHIIVWFLFELFPVWNFSGVCTLKNEVKSRIILSGDPKQLDAVTKSPYAKALGYNTSLMERLSKQPMFKIDVSEGQYNECVVTHLVNNYRSHCDILHVPNSLYYNNKLKAKAPAGL